MSFHNALIEKPYIKDPSNIDMSFYDEFNIVKILKALKRYAKSFSIEIIDLKDPLVQLTTSIPSIIFFKDLL